MSVLGFAIDCLATVVFPGLSKKKKKAKSSAFAESYMALRMNVFSFPDWESLAVNTPCSMMCRRMN